MFTDKTMIIMKKILTLVLALVASVSLWALDTDTDGYYLLGSVQDWQDFAAIVETTPNVNARMTADIDLGDDQTTAGTSSKRFQGIFDGQGHTLTINLTATDSYYGLFRYIDGASIQSLHITGSITTSFRFVGGLVGATYGICNFTNCRSSVRVKTSYAGDGVQGGFVSCLLEGSQNFNDCLFDGVLDGKNAQTWGCFVGWSYGHVISLSNCLVLCDDFTVSMSYVSTFVSGSGSSYTNCYYKTAIGTAQGTQATEEQLADGTIAAALQNGRAEEIWVQDPVLHTPMLKIFVKSSTPTAIDNTSISTKAIKRIVNGQLLIEKNGKLYNATGAEVK